MALRQICLLSRHKWHESALAISNPEIEAAFSKKSDELEEIALSQPIAENVA
ncbi:hypothetical protein [Iningainema tapete]|uniref:Uncharacterized protein n=1 Tax=Iningainema tapete BLCC-T55 TaxID=2748662 RepID=A0A8J6XZ19_9CYAN|nr:hypothetical protein [Iningainema tapete]MBD2775753.1 hypothetical protein [Iningainema tapete BLCC-T55]